MTCDTLALSLASRASHMYFLSEIWRKNERWLTISCCDTNSKNWILWNYLQILQNLWDQT